jgi:hypothetical protein
VASEDWDYFWRLSLLEPHFQHTAMNAHFYTGCMGARHMEDNFDHDQRDKDKVRVLEDVLRSRRA